MKLHSVLHESEILVTTSDSNTYINPVAQSSLALELLVLTDEMGEIAKAAARLIIHSYALRGAKAHAGPNGQKMRRTDNAVAMGCMGGFTPTERFENEAQLKIGETAARQALRQAYLQMRTPGE